MGLATILVAVVRMEHMDVFPAAIPVRPTAFSPCAALIHCFVAIKLSYVMSEYYERNNKDAQACSFSGNGTVNSAASNAVATSAATSCVSNPSATFVPSSPATLAGGSGGSSSTSTGSSGSSGSSGGGSNGAVEIVADRTVVFGVFGLVAIGVISGVWTLL